MQAMSELSWEELRSVLAIGRARRLVAAAQALRLDHSTLFRRLKALEARLATRLFDRTEGGYAPTEAGERLIAAALRIEAELLTVERDLAGHDIRLSGMLRVTASETLAYRLLTPELARFRTAHPGITVELILDNRALDLGRREADIALRALRPAEPELFGRKLADIAWAVYGRAGDPAPARIEDLGDHPVIGWAEGAGAAGTAAWLAAAVPPGAIAYRTSSLVNQLVAAKAGIGLAILPCYLADPEPELRRLFPPIPVLSRELWLITHADLRRTARIRAFMELVGDGLAAQRAVIAGDVA
jgi:DNA-binding transcriptional LysR family regulator